MSKGLCCVGGPWNGDMHPIRDGQRVIRLCRLKKDVTAASDQPVEHEEEYYFLDKMDVAPKIVLSFWRSSRLTHAEAVAILRTMLEGSR